ncbi:MAG: disulfide bond formation protein B [Pseudomonadota bacterium]
MASKQTLLFSFLIPAALLGGALAFQYIGGLLPCDLCLQQRWPHGAAIALGAIGLGFTRLAPVMSVLAPLAVMASGAVAVFHSGVERKWWPGPPCASSVDPNLPPAEYIKAIENAALINCHDIPWSFLGLSMANYNAIISLVGGAALLVMAVNALRQSRRANA